MKYNSKKYSLDSIKRDIADGTCTFDSVFQRKSGQWSHLQQSWLIDSIIRDYPIPPTYAVEDNNKYSVIDGCQRLTTIYEYLSGGFSISSAVASTVKVDGKEEILSGKKFKELSNTLQNTILKYQIDVVMISDSTEAERKEVFNRLNNGMPLTKAQKLKGIMSSAHTRRLAELAGHDALSMTKITEKQRIRDEDYMVVVRALMLITADKDHVVKGFSAAQIRDFLENYEKRYSDKQVTSLENDLDILLDIFSEVYKDKKHDKYIVTRLVIPHILFVIDLAKKDDAALERFKNNFKDHLEKWKIDDSELKEFGAKHTTSLDSIETIKEFFLDMMK